MNDTAERAPLRVQIMDSLHEMRGKNLACWCRLDQECHADVLIELANAPMQIAATGDVGA